MKITASAKEKVSPFCLLFSALLIQMERHIKRRRHMSILRLLGNKGTLPFFSYRSSKAAANMVVKSLAVDLKEKGITSVAFNPDWVKRSGLTNWDSPLSGSLAQPKPCTEHGVAH